jgi:hypothetical protein
MLTRSLSRWPRVKAQTFRSIDSIVQQVGVKYYILQKNYFSHKLCPSSLIVAAAVFEVRQSTVGKGKSILEFLKEA